MALDQLAVIEGDGTQNTVTVTDDPAQNATIQAVVDRLERVLKGQDNIDEVRVALTNDDLQDNLDVSVEDQTGDVAVTLGGEAVSVDSLPSLPQGSNRIGSVVVDGQPVGVSVDGQTGDLEVTLGTETVSVDSLPAVDISSESAGIATESTLDAIKTAAQALDDALASNGTDEIRVTSPSPLDVSASEVDVNLNSQTLTNLSVDLNAQSGPALDVSGATVTVTDDGALTLAANDGTDIGDVGIEDISPVTGQATKSGSLPVTLASDEDTVNVQEDTPLDASAAEIDVDLNSQSLQNVSVDLASDSLANPIDVDLASASAEPLDVSGATVPTEQQSPVKVEDSSGTSIDPATEQKLENVRSLLDDLDDALTSVASDTLRTEQQSPVAVEDTSGTQVDPARATDFPSTTTVGHDLSAGNLTVGPVPVGRSQALVVSGNPTGGGNFSATIEWTDGSGNVFRVQNGSDTEVDLSGQTSSASSRLFRKGPQAKVTFSGSDTDFNAFVDSHK